MEESQSHFFLQWRNLLFLLSCISNYLASFLKSSPTLSHFFEQGTESDWILGSFIVNQSFSEPNLHFFRVYCATCRTLIGIRGGYRLKKVCINKKIVSTNVSVYIASFPWLTSFFFYLSIMDASIFHPKWFSRLLHIFWHLERDLLTVSCSVAQLFILKLILLLISSFSRSNRLLDHVQYILPRTFGDKMC